MDEERKRRALLRSAFTRSSREVDTVLAASNPDLDDLEAIFNLLAEKMGDLKVSDAQILKLMIANGVADKDIDDELAKCDDYQIKFFKLKVRCNKVFSNAVSTASTSAPILANQSLSHKFKLPKIELKKFGGDIREWLAFWSQFKKVHEDEDLAPEDKFQYLISAMIPNSRAKDLIDSFPPTADNYVKAIETLEARFGRKDMLVEVYVRELLKLVLNNALGRGGKCQMATLYDRLETQLRALETLGITTDTCAAMLYPLVESCLPEELLRVWQRTPEPTDKASNPSKTRLNHLMEFLKAEVEGEERIALAVEGFGVKTKGKPAKMKNVEPTQATAAGLINNGLASKCVFCEGNHVTDKCFKAQKMDLNEKKKILNNKRACFRCAQLGHLSRRCRVKLRCVLCGEQHIVLLCPSLEADKSASQLQKKTEDVNLSNCTNMHVFLQTLVVKITGSGGEKEVRAIIDTGFQRSYVLKSVATEIKCRTKRTERIVHALFGGTQTEEQEHRCYEIRLVRLDGEFACRFEVLDQPTICSAIPNVFNGAWTTELKNAGIKLSDTGNCREVSVLIGADVVGKLLTGKKLQLKCGLVALETLLGWTLMGKIKTTKVLKGNVFATSTSLLTKDMPISKLWQLDVLGISDPEENRSKVELEKAVKTLFKETTVVNEEGRYEVQLPWKEGHPPLPNNYNLAKKRLQSVYNKLQATGDVERYSDVFAQWLSEGIIERIPQDEIDNTAHYLPHRPVFKESSTTTKVRPVFDASAKEKGRPSLNDCLEKGINLIELIPDVLLRFRIERVGVTSDIRKAFLQISLNVRDRDFLRFIWKTDEGKDLLYRHRRVVFGVNSSPFLLGATLEQHIEKYCGGEEENIYSESTVNRLRKAFYVDNCVTSVPDEQTKDLFVREATALMAEGRFELTGWECSKIESLKDHIVPLLGLNWNTRHDTLMLCYTPKTTNGVITKRIVLSYA
ncbi:uncharacterized protein [Onthophagus taurus]|uniref:uncharacterized protein n=1 Tax=Onthophagus taurus TaxID=166361 RepID=UPI0039BDAB05